MNSQTFEKEQLCDFWNRSVDQFNLLQSNHVPSGQLPEFGRSMDNDAIQYARGSMHVEGVELTGAVK